MDTRWVWMEWIENVNASSDYLTIVAPDQNGNPPKDSKNNMD